MHMGQELWRTPRTGNLQPLRKAFEAASLVVTHHGAIYVVDPGNENTNSGTVWLVKPNGKKSRLDAGLSHPSGIAISPDGLWLAVAENETHWGYSYRVQPDGTVQDKQRFYWFRNRSSRLSRVDRACAKTLHHCLLLLRHHLQS